MLNMAFFVQHPDDSFSIFRADLQLTIMKAKVKTFRFIFI